MAANENTLTPASKNSSWAPTAKVSVGVLAASVTTLFLAVFKGRINLEASQVAALTTLVTFAIQYLVPERK